MTFAMSGTILEPRIRQRKHITRTSARHATKDCLLLIRQLGTILTGMMIEVAGLRTQGRMTMPTEDG